MDISSRKRVFILSVFSARRAVTESAVTGFCRLYHIHIHKIILIFLTTRAALGSRRRPTRGRRKTAFPFDRKHRFTAFSGPGPVISTLAPDFDDERDRRRGSRASHTAAIHSITGRSRRRRGPSRSSSSRRRIQVPAGLTWRLEQSPNVFIFI